MKKLIAMLLVFVMAFALVACGEPEDTKPTETTAPAEVKCYTWNVTVVYEGYDSAKGEFMPAVTMTEKAKTENTATFDYYAALSSVGGDSSLLMDENNNANLTGELKTTAATFNENDFNVSDGSKGSTFSFEVVTPLTEGNYDTHGELKVIAKAKDYIWNVTVVFDPGTEGTYELINPGLQDWKPEYQNQKFTISPENNTFQLPAFNHSPWIVDNLATWYQWIVVGVDVEVTPKVLPKVTKYVTQGDRNTEGEVTIVLSLGE